MEVHSWGEIYCGKKNLIPHFCQLPFGNWQNKARRARSEKGRLMCFRTFMRNI